MGRFISFQWLPSLKKNFKNLRIEKAGIMSVWALIVSFYHITQNRVFELYNCKQNREIGIYLRSLGLSYSGWATIQKRTRELLF